MAHKVINVLEAADILTSERMNPEDISSSVPEFYLEKIKQILSEAIDGLRNLPAYKDKAIIKQVCDECQETLDEIQKLDLDKPDDKLKLLAVSGNIDVLRKFLLLEIGSLER